MRNAHCMRVRSRRVCSVKYSGPFLYPVWVVCCGPGCAVEAAVPVRWLPPPVMMYLSTISWKSEFLAYILERMLSMPDILVSGSFRFFVPKFWVFRTCQKELGFSFPYRDFLKLVSRFAPVRVFRKPGTEFESDRRTRVGSTRLCGQKCNG